MTIWNNDTNFYGRIAFDDEEAYLKKYALKEEEDPDNQYEYYQENQLQE